MFCARLSRGRMMSEKLGRKSPTRKLSALPTAAVWRPAGTPGQAGAGVGAAWGAAGSGGVLVTDTGGETTCWAWLAGLLLNDTSIIFPYVYVFTCLLLSLHRNSAEKGKLVAQLHGTRIEQRLLKLLYRRFLLPPGSFFLDQFFQVPEGGAERGRVFLGGEEAQRPPPKLVFAHHDPLLLLLY